MQEAVSVAKLFHFAAFVFMAAPLYMLIVVNERLQMGRSLDPRMDTYMENIIGHNAVRCFIFLGTVAASGLALLLLLKYGFGALVTNWMVVAKWVGTLALLSLLSYVHFSLQPRINRLVATLSTQSPISDDLTRQVWSLRRRRKRLASICLFLVLGVVTMGLRLTFGYSLWLSLLFLALAALFSWRVYRSIVPYGWVQMGVWLYRYITLLADVLTFLIIIRAILSWFPISPFNPVVVLLHRLTEPLLAPLRRAIPRAGLLDLTPLIAILLLQAVVYLSAYLLTAL